VSDQTLDSYLVAASAALERGEIDQAALVARMQEDGVFERADGEHVKVMLRGALMGEQMFGTDTAYATAFVTREVATRLRQPDVDYGLSIGVADAVAVADYVLSRILSSAGQLDAAAQYQTEIAQRASESDDWKGCLEALEELGALQFELERHGDAAACFAEALDVLDALDDPSDALAEMSSQDMLRRDSAKVAEFRGSAVTPLGDPRFLRSRLVERLARTSLLSGGDRERCRALVAQAEELRTDEMLADRPLEALDLLQTRMIVAMALGQLREAAAAGNAFVDAALALGEPAVASGTAAVTAHLYRELGEDDEANRLKAIFAPGE
jgi:hypothetical protein